MRSGLRSLARLAACALFLAVAGCAAAREVRAIKTELLDRPETFDVRFRGVASFREGTLLLAMREELRDFEDEGFSAAAIDDAAYTLQGWYQDQGFPFALVEYALERSEGGRPRVTLRVEEGPRVVVAEVRLRGNEHFDAEALSRELQGPTTGALGLGRLYLVEARARDAARAMEGRYFQAGFLRVEVRGPEIEYSTDRRSARLTYDVTEGPRFHLAAVELLADEGVDLAASRRAVEAFLGRPYFPRLAYEVRAAAEGPFAEGGHADVETDLVQELDPERGEARLRIVLHPGQAVRLRSVRVEGNARTREAFVREQLGLREGDLYARSAEGAAFRRLYATGLFDSVELLLQGDGPERDLLVRLHEAETLSVSAELGYGAWERARVILGVREGNLFGTGRSIAAQVKYAERARGLRLFVADPYTIDRDNVLGATTFLELREQVSFESREFGAGVNLTHHWDPDHRSVLGYEFRVSRAGDVTVDEPVDGEDIVEDVNISALYLTQVLDTRDSFFLPTRGAWLRARADLSLDELGTQLPFVRLDGRHARYHPLRPGTVLAWTVRLGVILPLEDEPIPIQERYFNGGQNTVRSFREDELGPKDDDGDPVGGEAFSVGSVELRQDIVGDFSLAFFVDAGNVSLDHRDALAFRDVRYGVGPGLRWLLPIGPVRLDWGINPDPAPDERDWVLQFSLGVAF